MITFVTCFINIYGTSHPLGRSQEWSLQHFRTLAETGICFCVYTDNESMDVLQKLVQDFPNVQIMNPVTFTEVWSVKYCSEVKHTLPQNRNLDKDTASYMQLMNAKTTFLQDAIEKNPWNTTHFSWIDFSIAYIFKNPKGCQNQLRMLNQCKLPTDCFYIPGCWPHPWTNDVLTNVCWRFCGGFILADQKSMGRFCRECPIRFLEFLERYHVLTWEVNIWAWMETVVDKTIWNPSWYTADHNDRILEIPAEWLCHPLSIQSCHTYDYPLIDNVFHPMSASYVFFDEKHWLNTRYVNYFVQENGQYSYYDKHLGNHANTIRNQNVLSCLEKDQDQDYLQPISYHLMNSQSIELPEKLAFSMGLEDIRLYTFQNRVRFVATTVSYSPGDKAWIMCGDYDVYTHSYFNCQIVYPPNESVQFEKNWTPIVSPVKNEGGKKNGWFINGVHLPWDESFVAGIKHI